MQKEEERQELLSYFKEKGHFVDGKIFGRNAEEFIKLEQQEQSAWVSTPNTSKSLKLGMVKNLFLGLYYCFYCLFSGSSNSFEEQQELKKELPFFFP